MVYYIVIAIKNKEKLACYIQLEKISSIVKISRDTLRYYDDVGILKPYMTDQHNGYRYYNDEQIKTLMQILEYKSYGLSLEEIKQMISSEDVDLLRLTLAKQYKSIVKQREILNETMQRIEKKILLLQGGKNMNSDMKKILIVDDAPFMRSVLSEILENGGYISIAVSSGEEALSIYHEEKPDLVLMDIEMPGMNGIECTAKIKEIDPNSNIVILSAHLNDENLKAAYSAGACYFQPKPFVHEDLSYCIRRVFEEVISNN